MLDAHAVAIGPQGMLALNACMFASIVWALWWTERNLEFGSDWSVLAFLALFAAAGRVLLEPIPNVQPVTVVVLLVGIHYGFPRAALVAISVTLLSNFFLGHGLWSLYQALGWSIIGGVGALSANAIKVGNQLNLNRLAVISGASAFIFGFVVSISALHSIGTENFLPYLVAGIPFDLLHLVGNLAFVAWMAAPVSEIITRHSSSPNHVTVREFASD